MHRKVLQDDGIGKWAGGKLVAQHRIEGQKLVSLALNVHQRSSKLLKLCIIVIAMQCQAQGRYSKMVWILPYFSEIWPPRIPVPTPEFSCVTNFLVECPPQKDTSCKSSSDDDSNHIGFVRKDLFAEVQSIFKGYFRNP
jgi:hypothetical protein